MAGSSFPDGSPPASITLRTRRRLRLSALAVRLMPAGARLLAGSPVLQVRQDGEQRRGATSWQARSRPDSSRGGKLRSKGSARGREASCSRSTPPENVRTHERLFMNDVVSLSGFHN